MVANKHEQIRRRAYEIWESEGRQEGANLRHWQQACEELGGNSDHETPQELDEVDRADAAPLQGAEGSGDIDLGSGKSPRARKKPNNAPSPKPAVPEVEITTGEKPSRQKIKKTEGP
ncbi:hypothetical protein ILFOPFJJ_05443 [Ensifer psoraleae]|uniref:DUF2934 domain-containing protein n=1 Tax=Sinorhizobium psoraleae TaxID=520838 RepID=UPI00156A66AE|nr:DUF2934 domain-containing protein [Sinorhizobium psoraleae]NRP74521.1 hypothetical protein [Sinorhizobium psoraleae]